MTALSLLFGLGGPPDPLISGSAHFRGAATVGGPWVFRDLRELLPFPAPPVDPEVVEAVMRCPGWMRHAVRRSPGAPPFRP